MQSTTHKIGDTYQRIGRYNLGAGTWAATSAVWGYGAALEHVKVQDLTVSLVALSSPDVDGNTHALTVSATSGETALWPEALLASDIVFTESAVVRSSEMYQIISGRWASGSDSDNPLAVIPSELLPVTQGATGAGVPDGGTTGQVLSKATGDDQDTEWVDPGAVTVDAVPTNGSGNAVSSNGVFDALATKAASGANSDITSLNGIASAQFGDGSAEAVVAGKLWYNATTGAWQLGMGGGNITQQIGEEFFTYGKASAAINDDVLTAIYRTGAVGASGVITFGPTVAGITDHNLIVGIATEDIAHNGFGRVTTNGIVRSIDTSGTTYGETWADNDTIWYNPATGGLTNVTPSAPGLQLSVGSIIKAHAASGMVQVKLSHANTTAADIAAIVNASTSKATPVDADAFAGIDSEASFSLKKFTWANIKATLKTYLDTLYQPLAANLTSWAGIAPTAKQDALVSGTSIKTINSTSLLGSGDIAISATPGGSTTQVQFNNAGAFAGDDGLTFDSSTKSLGISGSQWSLRIDPSSYSGRIGLIASGGSFAALSDANGLCISEGRDVSFSNAGISSHPTSGIRYYSDEGACISDGVRNSGNFRDLKLRNLIATGRIELPQYTTATRPAWVNGAQIFDSDLDKLLIGGASAWEVVTSI